MAERKSMTLVYRRLLMPFVYLLLAVNDSFGDVRLPALFLDPMVLQRGMEVPVWGWADPGLKTILVEWPACNDDEKSVREDKWQDSIKEAKARAVMNHLQRMEPFAAAKDIVNGTKWVFQKKYRGNPFIAEDYWPTAVLVYGGIRYPECILNYDLYSDQLILLYDDGDSKKFIVLSKDHLESFSYTDTINRKEHFYECFKLPGTGERELYEKLYEGKTALIIRPECEINFERSGMYLGEYLRSYKYYVWVDGRYEHFHSRKTLLEALKRNIPDLKRFIRKNRLKINKLHPENIVTVLKYFDELL
jgi:hypothetical protein